MFERRRLNSLDDYFKQLNARQEKCVYFYRINGFNQSISDFLSRYYRAARQKGVIIEGRIPNPDEKNLAYYEEMMGMDFQMSVGFISSSLKKWLPRMNGSQREAVAVSIYDVLEQMRVSGKNENMLKNAYIKFMCWFYYKFERIANCLGDNDIPKILYEGTVSNYELKFLSVLSGAGCDILLLQYQSDSAYLQLDRESILSDSYVEGQQTAFPKDFSIKMLQQEITRKADTERLYGTRCTLRPCTNAWLTGRQSVFAEVLTPLQSRGSEADMYYNVFSRIIGVEDKLTYLNELYQFQLEFKNTGRPMVVVENTIQQPFMEEIAAVRRKNYTDIQQLLMDLSQNIKYSANIELQRLISQTFKDILLEESKTEGMNLNRLTGKATYLLCWLNRYQPQLFVNWKLPMVSCFILFGSCKSENEALFLRFLSRLPVDVLVLMPNLNDSCCLEDDKLYEQHFSNSMAVEHFPSDNTQLRMGTAAYHAERELDEIMYQDSGMYRNQQYSKAAALKLDTMYEEIAILWDQELKYRPNFSVADGCVNIPVIFSKISGVKDGNVAEYWSQIKNLITEDTLVVRNVPFITGTNPNPIKQYATEFFKNGKLLKNKIKEHSCYQYGMLRDEIQEHILDKLQLLIEQRVIKGTFENGTEYTIISTILNMHKDIVRRLQGFDFTKKNPKFIYINTTENIISLEDSILMAFLNLAGFDILFFVPTGYQSVERYYNNSIFVEHQLGEYIYDLQTPDFTRMSTVTRRSWRDRIFKNH